MASGSCRSVVENPAAMILANTSSFKNLRASPGFGAYPSEIVARGSDPPNGITCPRVIESVLMVTSGGAERQQVSINKAESITLTSTGYYSATASHQRRGLPS